MIGENKSVGRKNKYGMLAQNFNRRTNVAMEHNGSRLCEGKGLEALNFKLSTND